jgi:hypothetical protein
MCKRCAKLELQVSLFTLSAQIARMWASDATLNNHFLAVQKLRTARNAVQTAKDQLKDHRRTCGNTETQALA